MRYSLRGLVVAAAAVSLAAPVAPAFAASATAGPPTWTTAELPAVVAGVSTLGAGAAVSADDVWAVGDSLTPDGNYQPIILRWNGTSWLPEETAGIPLNLGLNGVVTPSATTAWVSGQTNPLSNQGTSIYRLSGSSWVSVPLPSGVPLDGITSGPAGQVWATASNGSAVARWTGTAWQVYHTGLPAASTVIDTLGFSATSNGWAVGNTLNPAGPAWKPLQPVVLHWNGSRWRSVAAPSLPDGATTGELDDVTATKAAGVWATGSYGVGSTYYPWLVHGNGSSWQTVTLPASIAGDGESSPGGVIGNISVGSNGQPQWISATGSAGQSSGYLYHSGSTWEFVPGASGTSLVAESLVSVPGSNATWSVGYLSGPVTVPATAHIEYAP